MLASNNLFNHIFPSYSVWVLCFFPGFYEPFLLGKRLSGKSWCFSLPAFTLRNFDPHDFAEVLSWPLVFGIPGVQHMPFSKGILSGEYSHTFVCKCLLSWLLCVCCSFQAQPEKLVELVN